MNNENVKVETNKAIEQGLENAPEQWKKNTLSIIENLCRTKVDFTSDDIRIALADDYTKTHDPRVLGGLLRIAAKNKWCESTGVFSRSQFTHGHLHQIWRSLIYKNKETLW